MCIEKIELLTLLIHKDIPQGPIPHMPITELENGSESVWVKVFANKTSHFVASWYRPPDGKIEELELFKDQLEKVKTLHKGNKPPTPPPRSMSWVISASDILFGQIDSTKKVFH